eukprot:TRINITY_DN73655_c0_g1_i1.p1 TRINITY_DN73655_c0_g1~~TRINITY_DN73655_c0_g1_i1.p1  ORF type:complete len:650 (-),score=69.84 TRINITY_DN73655_c0_g1_i1:17-1966(-)
MSVSCLSRATLAGTGRLIGHSAPTAHSHGVVVWKSFPAVAWTATPKDHDSRGGLFVSRLSVAVPVAAAFGSVATWKKSRLRGLDDHLLAHYSVFNRAAAMGDVSIAELAFDELVEPLSHLGQSTLVWNTLLKAFAQKGDCVGASRCAANMRERGVPINKKTLGKLITAALNAGNVLEAERWLGFRVGDGSGTGFEPFSMVIAACAKAGQPLRAVAWMRRATEAAIFGPPEPVAFSALINAHARVGEIDAACGWLEQMIRLRLSPTIHAFDPVIAGYVRAGDTKAVAQWFSRMQEFRCDLNSASFSAMIDACAKRGDPRGAAHWLRRMRQSQYTPDVQAFTALMTSVRHHKQVVHWFSQMLESCCKPDVLSFAVMIDSCAKSRDVRAASQWLEHMADLELAPNEVCYSPLVRFHSRVGDMESAASLVADMAVQSVDRGVVTYTTLVDGYSRKGDLSEATRLIDEMRKCACSPNVITYNAVLNGYAKRGDLVCATAWIERMELSKLLPNIVSFTTIIDCHSRQGDVFGALRWWTRMEATTIQPTVVTFSALLRAHAARADIGSAVRLFLTMGVRTVRPDVVAWTTLLSVCARGRAQNLAITVQRAMLDDSIIPNVVTLRELEKAVGVEKYAVLSGQLGIGSRHRAQIAESG